MALIVSASVFDRTGTTVVQRLDDVVALQWLDELRDVGSFSVRVVAEQASAVQVGQVIKVAFGERSDDWVFAGVVESIKIEEVGGAEGIARVADIGGRGVRALLESAVVFPVGDLVRRSFTNETPGNIFRRLFNAAQNRGALAGMSLGFTGLVDSNNEPYDERLTLDENSGANLLAVASRHQELAVDVRVTPDLVVEYYNTFGVDRSIGADPTVLRAGYNVAELVEEQTGPVRNVVLVELGGNNPRLEVVSDAASIAAHGRSETFLSMTSTPDTGLAFLAAQGLLDDLRAPTEGYKVEALDIGPVPIIDYNVGDTVLLVAADGARVPLRVESIAASVDESGQVRFVPELGRVRPDLVRRLNNALSKVERTTANTTSELSDTFGVGVGRGLPQFFAVNVVYYDHASRIGTVLDFRTGDIITDGDGDELVSSAFMNFTEEDFAEGELVVLVPLDADRTVRQFSAGELRFGAVGRYREPDQTRVLIAVIDDTTGVNQTRLDDAYDALRARDPDAAIWLLVPGGATVALPSNWEDSPFDFGPITVAADNGDPDLADDWLDIVGITIPAATSVILWESETQGWQASHDLFFERLGNLAINRPATGVGGESAAAIAIWTERLEEVQELEVVL